jgi:hypothetical protein
MHPVVCKLAHITSNIRTPIIYYAGILKTFVDDLEEEALLGIRSTNLFLGEREERRIESGRILVQKVAMLCRNCAFATEGILEAMPVVPTLGDGPTHISS